MSRLKTFAIASCLGLLAVAFVPARADQWNKKTILTVNEPIALPTTVLQPGKYVIRLMDSQANRHIVQVFNEDEQQLITTILAIPNYKLEPAGDTEFSFWETAQGQPRALRSWFYPGDNFGQEFAYPKDTALQIAKANNQNVPAVVSDGQDMASAEVRSATPSGEMQETDTSAQAAIRTDTERDVQSGAAAAQTETQAQSSDTSASASAQSTPESATAAAEQQVSQTTPGSTRTGTAGEQSANEQQSANTMEQPGASTSANASAETTDTTASGSAGVGDTQVSGSAGAGDQGVSVSASAGTTGQDQGTARSESEMASNQTASSELPQTGSPLPLFGLAGLAAAAAAGAARVIRKR